MLPTPTFVRSKPAQTTDAGACDEAKDGTGGSNRGNGGGGGDRGGDPTDRCGRSRTAGQASGSAAGGGRGHHDQGAASAAGAGLPRPTGPRGQEGLRGRRAVPALAG